MLKRRDILAFSAVALCLLVPAVYLTVLAVGGADLFELVGPAASPELDRHEALPWAAVTLAAGVVMTALWWRDRARAGTADEDRSRREAAVERAEAGLERAQRARDTARRWSARMRQELAEAHSSRGVLGDPGDVPGLVLALSLKLLDADRGMLISRRDEDGDGTRRLVAARGFEGDPSQSALAQRFASEVIERDTIVREEGSALEPHRDSAADEEIVNLTAIPIYVRDEFSGVVVAANSDSFAEHDEEVLIALGDQAGAILENASLHGQLRGAYVSTVRMLADAIRAKDPHLGGHSQQVSSYVARVAERLGLDPKRREELVFASLLHDVGKIGISERILLKPGRLSEEEYSVVKLHPRIGSRLVQHVPALSPLAQFVLHHHERFDGEGYPTGLKGEEIPLEARVIGVADAFSAMTSDRPYRGRLSLDEACAELERNAGTQFDPQVVRVFVEEVRREPEPSDEPDAATAALDDPEFDARRADGEPLLGAGPLEVTDHLTLLYTHRYFHEVVEAESQRATVQGGSFAVVLFEVGGVHEINRREGFAAGDRAIKAAAHAVEQAAVRCGGTACRYNGRRLGLLIPGADHDRAATVADEVRRALPEEFGLVHGVASAAAGTPGGDAIAAARRALRPSRNPVGPGPA